MRGFRLKRTRGNDRGAQAVEFALISIPLLYLLYGAISFGFMLNAQETASQLAREGARALAICGTGGGCSGTATSKVDAVRPKGFTVDWTASKIIPCTSATGDASVTIVTHPPLTFVPFLTGSTSISGKATTPCGG